MTQHIQQLFIFAALTSVFAATPYIGRKDSCFGVLLNDAANSADVKRMQSKYRNMAVVTGIVLLLLGMWMPEDYKRFASILYVCLMLMLFMYYNKQTHNLVRVEQGQVRERKVYIPALTRAKPLSLLWYLLCIPIILATYLLDKGAILLPLAQVALAAVCIGFAIYIQRAAQYVDKDKLAASLDENARIRKRWQLLLLGVALLLLLAVGVFQLIGSGLVPRSDVADALLYVPFAALVALVLLFAYKNK